MTTKPRRNRDETAACSQNRVRDRQTQHTGRSEPAACRPRLRLSHLEHRIAQRSESPVACGLSPVRSPPHTSEAQCTTASPRWPTARGLWRLAWRAAASSGSDRSYGLRWLCVCVPSSSPPPKNVPPLIVLQLLSVRQQATLGSRGFLSICQIIANVSVSYTFKLHFHY